MTLTSKLKRIVPRSARRWIVAPARRRLHWSLAFLLWRQSRRARVARAAGAIRRIILLPSDFHGIVGSLGDDAMISATLHYLGEVFDHPEIRVMTSTSHGEAVVRSLGLNPVRGWSDLNFVKSVNQVLREIVPDAVVIVGADVIDGHYDTVDAGKTLIFADLASRAGAQVTVLGFSFNGRPTKEVIAVLNGIDSGVSLNLRDPMSMERFKQASSAKGRQVADVAFLLPPSEGGTEIAMAVQWVEQERAAGRVVLGLNIHPKLFRPDQAEAVERLVARTAEMTTTYVGRNVSWLLVPHDYRGKGAGDLETMDALMQRLEAGSVEHIQLLRGIHRAAELKGLAALLDGVVTGRMHLAIAALGSGVPVLTITYQDKFEGLFALAGLPSWLAVSADQALQDGVLVGAVGRFVEELAHLKATALAAKRDIRAMSVKNFAAMAELGA